MSIVRIVRRPELILTLLLVLSSRAARGQGCTLPTGNGKTCSGSNTAITMSVGPAVRLEVLSSLTVPNNDLKAADFVAGFKAAGTVSVTARANTKVSVALVQATTPATFSGFSWSLDGTTFNSPATVLTSPVATSGTTQIIMFRTKLAWDADAPGSYTETLIFTVASP